MKARETSKDGFWVGRSLYQPAWTAAYTKATRLADRYGWLAARSGANRAIIAAGGDILMTGYPLKISRLYQDLGADT